MKEDVWPMARQLTAMEQAIREDRENNRIMEEECGYADGALQDARAYDVFLRRRDHLRARYQQKMQQLRDTLAGDARTYEKFERRVATFFERPLPYGMRCVHLGEARAGFAEFEQMLPLVFSLPMAAPIAVPQGEAEILRRFLYRLLFCYPLGKCQLYAYDPHHFGGTLGRLSCLMDVEEVFPQKSVLLDEDHLKLLIERLKRTFLELHQRFVQVQCRNWREYNHKMRLAKEPRMQIPYRVLLCFDLPAGCKAETLQALGDLAREGEVFGFLLLFSYDPKALELPPPDPAYSSLSRDLSPEGKALKQLCAMALDFSKDARGTLSGMGVCPPFQYFRTDVRSFLVTPNAADVERDYMQYKKQMEEMRGKALTFDAMLDETPCFSGSAIGGLAIPVGLRKSDGTTLLLHIDDATPHFLIGGGTGSGKSVFQHVLIFSACWKYAPSELSLYLLDFKDGVEFAAYANPCLPHAALVAMRADPDFALTVLSHLVRVLQERNVRFKEADVNDYKSYREKCPEREFPRIVLFIDEVQNFLSAKPEEAMKLLQILAKQGRSAGIHMVLATQSFRSMGTSTTVPFSDIKGQFAGHVALRCDAPDSAALLGMGNEEAATIKVAGDAILNVSQGVEENQWFHVPMASKENRQMRLAMIRAATGGYARETRVFDGQKKPPLPEPAAFAHKGFALLVGEQLSYERTPFWIPLTRDVGENVLLCGNTGSLVECLYRSVSASQDMDAIAYIGGRPPAVEEAQKPLRTFLKPMEFYQAMQDAPEKERNKRWLVILDGCRFPDSYVMDDQTKDLLEFFEDAPLRGSHLFACYRSIDQKKNSNLPDGWFSHILANGLSQAQVDLLSANPMGGMTKAEEHKGKVAYIDQGVVTWFLPFEAK